MQEEAVKEISSLFSRRMVLPGVTTDHVMIAAHFALAAEDFKSTNVSVDGTTYIVAKFGSKAQAFFINLIPLFGSFILRGMRFIARVSIKQIETDIEISIALAPQMMLFDEEPMAPYQVVKENFLSSKLQRILAKIYEKLELPIPEEFQSFQNQNFIKGAWWRIVLYELEPFSTRQPIHYKKGVRWSWGAFLVPEVWFLWNELWGASSFVIIAEYLLYSLAGLVNSAVLWTVVVIIHLITGLIGSKVYYYRYGRWP